MDLVFIYGPPASGKLTVSKELSKITGFKLFHNHLILDIVHPFFDWGTKPFNKLVRDFRIDFISEAAKSDIKGLIFTFCYAKNSDDKFVKTIIDIVKKHKGKTHFVLLKCEKSELYKRVKSPSRKKFSKSKTIKNLKDLLNKYELFEPIPFVKNLVIDNTNISAPETARQIQKWLLSGD